MRIRTFLKPFSFLPAIVMMYLIFSFSAQTGEVSASISYRASVVIVEAADYVFDANLDEYQIHHYAEKIHFITRKLAHMTEYFLLAVAVSFPLYVYGLHGLLLVLVAGLFCVTFACGDEYHQSFVAGRGPSVKDVGIDSFGILVGIILVRIVGWTGRKTIFRPVENDDYRRMTKKELKKLQKQQDKLRREFEKDQKARRQSPGGRSSVQSSDPYDDPRFYTRVYQGGREDKIGYRDPRYGDPRYDDPKYDDPRYSDPRYDDPGYDDPRYSRSGYIDPRYDDYVYEDDYYGEPDVSSDELSDDMPLSKLFHARKK